jgi:fructosamine-3-kinase
MNNPLYQQLEAVLGYAPRSIQPLIGGCIAEVYRVDLPDGRRLVAKVADGTGITLEPEGYMLRYLAEHSQLPVPEVVHHSERLLVMSFVEGDSFFNTEAQYHAADLLADLHEIRGASFGLERNTLIGSLHQPNPQTDSWIAFFRDQRLLYMGWEAAKSRRLPDSFLPRLDKLASRLDDWLEEPEYPSLIHGDVWTTNVLAMGGRITAFLDPAIYYAHPEIELAFITLFNTFGAPFFERYHARRPIEPGFFELRRALYNLYPLLVHVRLFGGGYVGSVDRILRRVGI